MDKNNLNELIDSMPKGERIVFTNKGIKNVDLHSQIINNKCKISIDPINKLTIVEKC